jgi:lysophospholipase L1-like esterase
VRTILSTLAALLLIAACTVSSSAAPASNVLILGTSTTQGMGATPSSNRYASLVQAERPSATFTIHGVGGTTLADPATPNWLAYSVPTGFDTVVLQFGFNEWNRSTPAATFETWAVDFMTRVRTANPGARIVWLSPWISQYTAVLPDVRAELWQQYGMATERALRAVGGSTAHVDLDPTGSRRLAAPYSLGAPDGLHYNNKGHRAIADALLLKLDS